MFNVLFKGLFSIPYSICFNRYFACTLPYWPSEFFEFFSITSTTTTIIIIINIDIDIIIIFITFYRITHVHNNLYSIIIC